MSQFGSHIQDLQESPQLALKKNKMSFSNRKNHKSIDLQAKRKKNYTVQQQYEPRQFNNNQEEQNNQTIYQQARKQMDQAEFGNDSEDYPLHQSLQNSMGMRKSKSNMKLAGNPTVN